MFTIQGCKQQDLWTEQQTNPVRLTIAEAKAHFDKNFKKPFKIKKIASTEVEAEEEEPIETFEDLVANKIALWNSAFELEIDNGQLVSIPLDVAQPAYVKVNDSTEYVVPFSSLNYVHMYKDTNNEIQTYWVTYFPSEDWLNGQRSSYSGLAIVRSWDGSILRVDNYDDGIVDNDIGPGSIQICLVFDNGYISPIGEKNDPCACIVTICATIPPPCVLCGDPPIGPPVPVDEPGAGPPDPISGGGSSNPNTPPPLDCNPDPDYEVPDYPAPEGMEWISPCGDGPTEVPIPQPLPPASPGLSFLLADHGIFLSPYEQSFLEANPILLDKLTSFLNQNNSPEYAELVQWGIMEMSLENITWEQFENLYVIGVEYSYISENPNIDTYSLNISLNYSPIYVNEYFTEVEFNDYLDNLENGINGDPIEFYLIAAYKNSKLLHSSTYSINSNSIKVGEFILTPHYDSSNTLKFYSAYRDAANRGIEYIVRADALNTFKNNYSLYKAAANAFYINGIPSQSQIQIAAGDFFEGLTNSWQAALSDPMYLAYVGNVLIGSALGGNIPKGWITKASSKGGV